MNLSKSDYDEIRGMLQKAEPVAWINNLGGLTRSKKYAVTPLYIHPPIPEGWQLVPVEPTDEMCRALWRRDRLDTCGIIWERVLQAAPKPGETE